MKQLFGEFLRLRQSARYERGLAAFGKRRHAQSHFGDDSQRAEGADKKFAHVIAGDILDDLAAGFDLLAADRELLSCR